MKRGPMPCAYNNDDNGTYPTSSNGLHHDAYILYIHHTHIHHTGDRIRSVDGAYSYGICICIYMYIYMYMYIYAYVYE